MTVSTDQWRLAIGLFHGVLSKGFLDQCYFLSFKILIEWLTWTYMSFHNAVHSNFSILKDGFLNNNFTLFLYILLLKAFDIEQNPGPINSTSDLSLLHLNTRSIRNKLEYIKDNFLDYNILCFSETHLDNRITSDSLVLSELFDTPHRKVRSNHGGGPLVYINSEIIHTRKPELEIFCDESIWVEIKVNNLLYLLGLFYSPTTANVYFFNNLNLNIEKALEVSRNVIIVGDLNEDLSNPNFHNLKDVLMLNSLQNTITDPTRQRAILDPILIPDDLPYLDSGTRVIPSEISDHKATFIRFPFQYHCQKSYDRQVWLYKKTNFNQLKQLVLNYNLNCLYEGSTNDAFEKFTHTFLSFVKTSIPSKLVTVRSDDKPWFDSEIRHFLRIRDRLKRKALKSGNPND